MSKEPGDPVGRLASAGKPSVPTAELFASARRHEAAGRFRDAEMGYRQILVQDPNHADSFDRLGLLAFQSGQNDVAIALFGRACLLKPREPVFLFNLANALLEARRAEEAAALYRDALAISPELRAAHHNLGLALCALNDLDAGFAAIRNGFDLRSEKKTREDQLLHKIRHDREQFEYLIDCGIVDPAAIRSWRQRSSHKFQELFAGLTHLEGGARLATPAVNPDAGIEGLQRQWRERKPQLVVIDDFLTPMALEELRRFCLGSTIWQETYQEGYIGAFPENGFSCPLLAQIAAELRERYPAILHQHALNQWWAFKYDSQLTGIKVHADFAAVNINFWITPDEANLDPAGCGLIIWDTPAPLGWNFATYNKNEDAARAFLTEANAKPIVVPYRANRAVIFDSDLFHETDQIRFKDGYRNRRINITLLYGWRT